MPSKNDTIDPGSSSDGGMSNGKKDAGQFQIPAPPSIVSSDLTIEGDLISTGDIHIDGVVHGDVRSSRVTIGESATVDGSVFAQEVVISGAVEGEIFSKSVILTKSASVQGDVVHESLSIEAGAFIQGICRRMSSTDPQGNDGAKSSKAVETDIKAA